MAGDFLEHDGSEFVTPSTETLLSRVRDKEAEREAAAAAKPEEPKVEDLDELKDGLYKRVKQGEIHGEMAEGSPDVNRVLIETFGKVEQRVIAVEPAPGENTKEYQRRIVFALQDLGKATTSEYPADQALNIPQGGLMERIQQRQEQAGLVEDTPDINRVLIDTFLRIERNVVSAEPEPGENTRDYQRRLIFSLQGLGREVTTEHPPKANPSSELFKQPE